MTQEAPHASMSNAASGDMPAPPQIPLIDPTANVLALVAAAITRQDDLRAAARELEDERIRRQDELRILMEKCSTEISNVHLQGNKDLAIAETNRIDALLLAAKADVALASEKSAAQAATLAQQVATSAEALRSSVTSLATQIATQTAQMREAIEKRLTLLEQSQYSIGGRDIARESAQVTTRETSDKTMSILVAVAGMVFGLAGSAIGGIILLVKG